MAMDENDHNMDQDKRKEKGTARQDESAERGRERRTGRSARLRPEDERRLLISEDEPRTAQEEQDRYEQDYEL
jgi:hypothetical protein